MLTATLLGVEVPEGATPRSSGSVPTLEFIIRQSKAIALVPKFKLNIAAFKLRHSNFGSQPLNALPSNKILRSQMDRDRRKCGVIYLS